MQAITREHVARWHETWFKPDNATLVVVGDTTLAEIRPKLETLFASWKPGSVPKKNVAAVEAKAQNAIYLIDRPGALQSLIIAGQRRPAAREPAGDRAGR